MSNTKVIIIGGGISGLTAAWELTKRGYKVMLLERREVLGGLARSTQLNGKFIEVYYHFICGGDRHLIELAGELGLEDRLHWRPGRTSYFVGDRLYPFSTPGDVLRFPRVSLLSRLRFGLHALRCRRMTDWPRIEHLTARDWLIANVGPEAYKVIWKPLLEVKFGRYYQQISAPWIWHRLYRFSQSRRSLLRAEQLGYLEGGSHTLLMALANEVTAQGGLIRTGVEATGLGIAGERVAGVETSSGYEQADAVVAAVPLPELVTMLPPASPYRQKLAAIDFSTGGCVRLALRRSLTESFWININSPQVPFNGFVEYSNLNPWREYGGSEILYVPFYLHADEPRWQWSEAQFIETTMAGLKVVEPEFDQSWVVKATVSRDWYAQAICSPHFSKQVPALRAPVGGLFVLDSTQLYPADRNLSGMIRLARSVARVMGENGGAHDGEVRRRS